MDRLDYKLLVCGPAGAGKSTLVERISQEFGVSSFDVRTLVIDFLRRTGKAELIGDELKPFYRELIATLPTCDDTILEIANDWPELFLGGIINAFFGSNNGRMLYVVASLEVCLDRVRLREYPTPESTIKRQQKYTFAFYKTEADKRCIPIISVSGELDFGLEYAKVNQFLKNRNYPLCE